MILLPSFHPFVTSTACLSLVTCVTKTSAAGINQTWCTSGTKEKVPKTHVHIIPQSAPVAMSLYWDLSTTVRNAAHLGSTPWKFSVTFHFTTQRSLSVNWLPSISHRIILIINKSFFCPNVPLWKNASSINQAFTRETLIAFWYAWFVVVVVVFGGVEGIVWMVPKKKNNSDFSEFIIMKDHWIDVENVATAFQELPSPLCALGKIYSS